MQKSHAPESHSSDATDILGFPLVDDQGALVTEDRRRKERRHWGARPEYPLVDSGGDVIARNRRRVVERRVHGSDTTDPSGPVAEHGPVLTVRYGGQVWEVTRDSEALLLGRRDECQLRVPSKVVSRDHARIEAGDGGFVLSDISSNGTFIRFEDGEAHEVYRTRLALSRSGVLRLGRPVENGADDLIRFWVST